MHVRAKQTSDLTSLHDRFLATDGVEATNTILILQTEKLHFFPIEADATEPQPEK